MPFVAPKWRPPSSNRKKSFAEIQKTEGKPCRDLDQGEAISKLIAYQGRISIMYTVSRHSAFQAAQRAFRSNRLSHEIGRRNLPRGKKLLPFAEKREDGRHSPAEVLGWKSGCSCCECSSLLNFQCRKNAAENRLGFSSEITQQLVQSRLIGTRVSPARKVRVELRKLSPAAK